MLNNSIQTSFGTRTILVTFINASDDYLIESPVLVADILVDLVLSVAPGGLDGELPTGALVLLPAVVRAVAARHELGPGVEVHVLLRDPDGGVLHVLGVVPVDGVDAGHGHVLLPVAQVLDGAELSPRLELVVHVEPPVEVEKVNFQ